MLATEVNRVLEVMLEGMSGDELGLCSEVAGLRRQLKRRASRDGRAAGNADTGIGGRLTDGLHAPETNAPEPFYEADYRSNVGTLPFCAALPSNPLGLEFHFASLLQMGHNALMRLQVLLLGLANAPSAPIISCVPAAQIRTGSARSVCLSDVRVLPSWMNPPPNTEDCHTDNCEQLATQNIAPTPPRAHALHSHITHFPTSDHYQGCSRATPGPQLLAKRRRLTGKCWQLPAKFFRLTTNCRWSIAYRCELSSNC